MNNLKNFEEFINESLTPVLFISSKNKNRNEIVKFVWEKQKVTKKELIEFAQTLGEGEVTVDNKWISRNKQLIKCIVNEDGPNHFVLTKLGKRFAKSLFLNETKGKPKV
jgi:hypothetical protein